MAGRKITSIRLSEARTTFLQDMRNFGKAENTISVMTAPLKALEQVIGNKVVRNIDKKDVADYFGARAEGSHGLARLQQSSLNLHTQWLRVFFEWCVEEAYIEPTARPMRGRKTVTVPPKDRLRLTQDQFPALLDAAPNPRDRVVLVLGLYTFCRTSEMATIRVGDVHFQDRTIDVTRHKVRTGVDSMPLAPELRDELGNYLAWYSTFIGKELQPEWYLAPGNRRRVATADPETHRFVSVSLDPWDLIPAKKMWSNGYAVIVQKALRALGYTLEAGEGVHTLRRSGARELFDELRSRTGFDDALLTVMSMLGHKQPSTTLTYLGVEREAARRNAVLGGDTPMFPRAAAGLHRNVVQLRAVE